MAHDIAPLTHCTYYPSLSDYQQRIQLLIPRVLHVQIYEFANNILTVGCIKYIQDEDIKFIRLANPGEANETSINQERFNQLKTDGVVGVKNSVKEMQEWIRTAQTGFVVTSEKTATIFNKTITTDDPTALAMYKNGLPVGFCNRISELLGPQKGVPVASNFTTRSQLRNYRP